MNTSLISWRKTWPEDRLQCWAIGALYAFAFLAPNSISLGQLMQAIMLMVAVFFVARNWSAFRGSPLIGMALFFIAYVVLRGFIAAQFERPDLAAEQWVGVNSWYKTAVVPMVLIGLTLVATGNWLRHAVGIVVALLAGTVINLLFNVSPEDFMAALQGRSRYEFDIGFRVAAITLPAAILGTLLLSPYLLSRLADRPFFQGVGRMWLVGLAVLLSLVVVGLVAALIATKSRNGWLTLLLGLMVVVPLALWYYRRHLVRPGRTVIVSLVLSLVLIGGLLHFSWDSIEQRWGQVSQTVTQVAELPRSGGIEQLKRDSVGVRVAYWAFGWERFMDRAVFGYGAADQRHLTDDYPIPRQLENRGDTYHNSHIDLLLRFGLVGYLPVLLVILMAMNEARKQMARPGPARVLGLYMVGFVVALAFWAMNAQQFERFHVDHVYGVIIGTMCAALLARRVGAETPDAHAEGGSDG